MEILDTSDPKRLLKWLYFQFIACTAGFINGFRKSDHAISRLCDVNLSCRCHSFFTSLLSFALSLSSLFIVPVGP